MAPRLHGALALGLLALACRGPIEPGDSLVGHWRADGYRLDATAAGISYAARCVRAEFGPVTLDANREFHAESLVYTVSGLVIHSPGDRLQIQGRFVGDQLVLQLVVIRSEPPVFDPLVVTLSPGVQTDPLVCNS
jgi:hypothetical protein